ncbi:hypothetical protein ZIOFF_057525 [Zingiber officinale]|uniref:Uncharacterized protein n=1 Tax=Zingiber officinale TaxID=94328 RepID=A0A8J5KGZ1_ZINOF|nr:hypothetical protein ZIOFF_057525 [Zingiber officinale]
MAIEESKDLEMMAVEELMGSLEAYEQKILKKSEGRILEKAFQAKLLFKKCELFRECPQRGRASTWRERGGRTSNSNWHTQNQNDGNEDNQKDMEEAMVEAKVKVVDKVETLDGGSAGRFDPEPSGRRRNGNMGSSPPQAGPAWRVGPTRLMEGVGGARSPRGSGSDPRTFSWLRDAWSRRRSSELYVRYTGEHESRVVNDIEAEV